MATPTTFAERRAAVRYQLTTKGWLLTEQGQMVEFRTSDLSTLGAGIWHSDPLVVAPQPLKMLLTLPLSSGVTRLEATAEVRYSVHAQGGFRSGLLFRGLTPAQSGLLAAALKGRLQVLG